MGTSLLTVAEVAEELAVHPKTVRRLIAKGELAAVKVGTAIRVVPADVGAFVEGHRATPQPRRNTFPRVAARPAAPSGAFAQRLRSIQREHSP